MEEPLNAIDMKATASTTNASETDPPPTISSPLEVVPVVVLDQNNPLKDDDIDEAQKSKFEEIRKLREERRKRIEEEERYRGDQKAGVIHMKGLKRKIRQVIMMQQYRVFKVGLKYMVITRSLLILMMILLLMGSR